LTKTPAIDPVKTRCFDCHQFCLSASVEGLKNTVSSGALIWLFHNEKRWMPIIKTTMATITKDGTAIHSSQTRRLHKIK
jgi:hypothetical protein